MSVRARRSGELEGSLDLSDVFTEKNVVVDPSKSGSKSHVCSGDENNPASPRKVARPLPRRSKRPDNGRSTPVSLSDSRSAESKESGRSEKHSSREVEHGSKPRKSEHEKRKHKVKRKEDDSVEKPRKESSSRKLSSGSGPKREKKSDKSEPNRRSSPRRTKSSDISGARVAPRRTKSSDVGIGGLTPLRRPTGKQNLSSSASSMDYTHTGTKMKSVLDNGGSVSSDGEDDYGDESAVFQFDPTQADNVYVVKQTHNSDSEYEVNSNDGSQSLVVSISEMKDPMADAQQHQESSNKKPIFDFLEDELPMISQPETKTRSSREKTRSRTKSRSQSRSRTETRDESRSRKGTRDESKSRTKSKSPSRRLGSIPPTRRPKSPQRSQSSSSPRKQKQTIMVDEKQNSSKGRLDERPKSPHRSQSSSSPRKQKQTIMVDEKQNSSKGSIRMVQDADSYSKFFASDAMISPAPEKLPGAKRISKHHHLKNRSDVSIGLDDDDHNNEDPPMSLGRESPTPSSKPTRIRKGHKKTEPSQRKKAVPAPVVGSYAKNVATQNDAPFWPGGEVGDDDVEVFRPTSPAFRPSSPSNRPSSPNKPASPNNQEWDSGDDEPVVPPKKGKSVTGSGPVGGLGNSIGKYFGKMKRNSNPDAGEDDAGSVTSAGSKGSLFGRGGRRRGHQLLDDAGK